EEEVGNAVAGLLPLVTGRNKQVDAAVEYLREVKRRGYVSVIEEHLPEVPPEIAARVRRDVVDYVERVYPSFDEATTPAWLSAAIAASAEKRPTTLPEWVSPADLPPLVFGERSLNPAQMEAVLKALRQSTLTAPAALIGALKKHGD